MHNEQENCVQLIEEILSLNLKKKYEDGYEIICVDDNSSDQTLSILKGIKDEIPQLRLIHLRKRCGQSTALCVGVERARAKIIVTLDGDGQNDPADVPALLHVLDEQCAQGVRMVAGWRKQRKDTFWRRFSSRLANSVRAFLLRDQTPDTGCGLKVFYRSSFMAMPWFDHMHRFLPALIQRGGGKVLSVQVRHRPRLHGTSHYGTWDRLRVGIIDLFGVAWLQRRNQLPRVVEVTGKEE